MAITKLNSLAIPDDTIVEADLSYPLTGFSSTGIDDNASSTAVTIDANEQIGVGTIIPDAILHTAKTQASGDVPIILENSGTSGVATASVVFAGSGGGGAEKARIQAAVYGDGYMTFHTNDDSEKMRLDASGNLGVGTDSTNAIRLTATTPTANHIGAQIENTNTADSFGLVVKAGNDANDYTADFRKRDNTNIMRIIGDGFVGVGSNTPRYNLAVKGNNPTAVGIAVDNDSGNCDVDLAALGSNYNAHGAQPNEAWLFCANNINLGSATGQSSAVKFLSGGSENARIDADGIKFNADTAAANALDDYEEGTWTPTVTTSSSVTVQQAQYTKIGRQVTISCYIQWVNNQNNNTGMFQIGGLPFTGYLSNHYEAASVGYVGAADTRDFLFIKDQYANKIYIHQNDGDSAVIPNSTVHTKGFVMVILSLVYQLPS